MLLLLFASQRIFAQGMKDTRTGVYQTLSIARWGGGKIYTVQWTGFNIADTTYIHCSKCPPSPLKVILEAHSLFFKITNLSCLPALCNSFAQSNPNPLLRSPAGASCSFPLQSANLLLWEHLCMLAPSHMTQSAAWAPLPPTPHWLRLTATGANGSCCCLSHWGERKPLLLCTWLDWDWAQVSIGGRGDEAAYRRFLFLS